MKIVFVAYLHGFGGAEKQIIMLANEMVSRGHDVTLVSLAANNLCYELDKKIKYIYIPDKYTDYRRLVFRYYKLYGVLKTIKCDLVVNFWFQSAYMTACMNKSIIGKVVYAERGDPSDAEYTGILGMIRNLCITKIDGFVFQSQGAKKYFPTVKNDNYRVIMNPISFSKKDYEQPQTRRKAIINVGRLHPQKNQKLLIDAFSKVASDFPEYLLEIYGEGPLEKDLKNQIRFLHLEDRAFLRGTSNNILDILNTSSLFVLTSDYEGLPNVLIEAMVLGVPCISTDCRPGGAREIIINEVNGLIVPCNDVQSLEKAMRRFLQDDGQLALKNDNKDYEDRFKKSTIYDEWESFFEQLRC